MRRAVVVCLVLGIIVVQTVSCARSPSGLTTDRSNQTGQSSSVSYDREQFGDLETLDPTGEVVTYWHFQTGAHEQVLLDLVDRFNRSNQWGITVLAESQGSSAELRSRVFSGIASGRLPSMAAAHPAEALSYAYQDAVVPLTPYVYSRRWGYTDVELRDFYPGILISGYAPQLDARFGWPFYRSMDVLYYNQDWLVELGYDGPPETWERFTEMACAAARQRFSNAKGRGTTLGYEYAWSSEQFIASLFSHGGDMTDGIGTRYVFGGPEGVAALSLQRELTAQECAHAVITPDQDEANFGSGWTLFTLAPVHYVPQYTQLVERGAGFEWSVQFPPYAGSRPRMRSHGPGHSIFANTPKNQLAAWLFIRWMSEPAQQAEWVTGTSYLPVRASTTRLLSDYLAANPAYGKALGFMRYDYGLEIPMARYDECRTAIEHMLAAVANGEDVASSLDLAASRCNEHLQ
ncbi:MAG: extracellular solute-binding protein [Chloroflexi bacterium]|nr:extracellular solute-binding protein [Chloroflexota bacterium]